MTRTYRACTTLAGSFNAKPARPRGTQGDTQCEF
jgi:hypothetical protein